MKGEAEDWQRGSAKEQAVLVTDKTMFEAINFEMAYQRTLDELDAHDTKATREAAFKAWRKALAK